MSWRKSSYSGDVNGSCVEVRWRKSSHSGNPDGNCVEVAMEAERVGVRDSKNVDGPRLAFPSATWRAFLRQGNATR
jgi:hypothetical protein